MKLSKITLVDFITVFEKIKIKKLYETLLTDWNMYNEESKFLISFKLHLVYNE